MLTEAAASRAATMPLLALNRKDTGWRIDWQIRPLGLQFGQPNPETLLLWPYRDRRRYHPPPPHAIVVCASLHTLIVGPATALRRNPGNIAVWVLHVAGFAVDAVLGVDLEARACGLLDPFVHAGRAITVRRTGIDVVLGRLLQVHVGDLGMHRLILFVIGIGEEHRGQLVEGNLAIRL